jgi:hypothetical protein
MMLNNNWFINDTLDVEYKRYLLLAYFQQVNEHFSYNKVFPDMKDLQEHHQTILSFLKQRKNFENNIPKRIDKFDWNNLSIVYKDSLKGDVVFNEMDEIFNFALPKFEKYIKEGKDIINFVEDNLQFEVVGIDPLYKNEGYLLLQVNQDKRVHVYQYSSYLFSNQNTYSHYTKTKFLTSFHQRVSEPLTKLKRKLINMFKILPNPATYYVSVNLPFPIQETLLPIAVNRLNAYVFK